MTRPRVARAERPLRTRRTRRTDALEAVRVLVWLGLAVGACGSPPPPKEVEMVPIGTVPAVNLPPEEETAPAASKPEGTSKAPPSATTKAPVTTHEPEPAAVSTPPPPRRDPACTGSDIDASDDLLRRCEAPLPRAAEVTALRSKLDVRLSSSTPTTSPGGRVDLSLTFRNTTSTELPLYFVGTDSPRFVAEASDRSGRRVDRPATRPPALPKSAKHPHEPKAFKLSLLPGGVARVRLAWDAQKARWAPERLGTWDGHGPYPTAPAGTLGPGRYVLRVAIPLLGYAIKDAEMPKTTIDVTP